MGRVSSPLARGVRSKTGRCRKMIRPAQKKQCHPGLDPGSRCIYVFVQTHKRLFNSLDSGSAAGMTRKREMAELTTIIVPSLCLLHRPRYNRWSHPNSNHSGKSIHVHHKNGFGWYNGNRPHWSHRHLHWSSAPAHRVRCN